MSKSKEWLDFNEIKANADSSDVLMTLGLLDGLEQGDKEWTGWCPLGDTEHGKKDSFAYNPEKRTFQCFSCKKRGSIIDLVKLVQKISLRDSARFIRDVGKPLDDDTKDKMACDAVRQEIRGADATSVGAAGAFQQDYTVWKPSNR